MCLLKGPERDHRTMECSGGVSDCPAFVIAADSMEGAEVIGKQQLRATGERLWC